MDLKGSEKGLAAQGPGVQGLQGPGVRGPQVPGVRGPQVLGVRGPQRQTLAEGLLMARVHWLPWRLEVGQGQGAL